MPSAPELLLTDLSIGGIQLKEKMPRIQYWDNIKGILIIITVFAHILFQLQDNFEIINNIVDYIYMFHMPAFVFVSGYFGKSERSRSAEAIIRLIFLYFVFNSIMGFLFGFGQLLVPRYSYWYLLALIVWRLTAPYLAKFREINLILFAITIFAGFFSSINNTFAAARILAFYPFYMLGYKLTAEKSDELVNTKYTKRLLKGITALAAAGTAAYFAYGYFGYSDDSLQMLGYDHPIGAFGRIALFVIAYLAIYALRNICPDKKIPLLSMLGRNSLWIFLLHRPFTLWLSDWLADKGIGIVFIASALGTAAICFAFGNGFVVKYLNRFADSGVVLFVGEDTKKFTFAKLAAALIALGFVASVVISSYSGIDLTNNDETLTENNKDEIIYPVMSSAQKYAFDNAFHITFAGDLILLEDQVKRGYTGDGYDFSEVFEYAKKYIASADYAIGVFEGPMAGEDAGYSTSNFDDGKKLYLNFPDEFAEAVQDAGFDLVTTANNHVLDRGPDGAFRTLDVLDEIGLDHTGSYRNESEKQNNRVKLVECDGIRMVFLSYTYGSNYYNIYEGELSYVTSAISGTEGEQFEKLKAQVERDFEEARSLSPDLIIVLPHLGTQFSNEPDDEQIVWFDIFKEFGADIILGDHPHVVEPVLIEDYNGRKVFTAYCPGNFANVYRKNQGDTSMLVDVYIDRDSKQVIGGGIVPLYTQSSIDGNYRALPIYEIVYNYGLRKQLSTDDYARAQNALDIIASVVFNTKMDISSITERYYFDESGFIRIKTSGLELTEEMKNGELYKAFEKADSICFIGDSLTEGTKNGGCPWYEPIEEYLYEKEIYNFSKGGCTVSYINENADSIPIADLYVIAVGTNDVRYRDRTQCAMTAEDYVNEIDKLRATLLKKNDKAGFVFIAPWYSTDGDPFCPLSYDLKTQLNDEYSKALNEYCDEQKIAFINANTYIRNMLCQNPDSQFLLDHIHPNSGKGVVMYSEAALLY